MHDDKRAEINRYVTILVLTVPAAAIVWFAFHGVYENLTLSEKAVGYIDPLTQMLVDLGYFAMVGGTLVFAAIAAWAAVRLIRLLVGR